MAFDVTVLTRAYARKHTERRYGIFRTLREAFSDNKDLWKNILEELGSENGFARTLEAALGDDNAEKMRHAQNLLLYLKSRAPVLKFWSTLLTSFTTIFGFASAFIALMFNAYDVKQPWLLAALIGGSAVMAALRYWVDKRLFWYDYVGAHLDHLLKYKLKQPAG